jgi:hypothetical protein
MNSMGILPVMTAFKTHVWTKISLSSFHEVFPDDLVLVVDNNPEIDAEGWTDICREETEWLTSHPNLLYRKNPNSPKRHGLAMDLAASAARELGYKFILHFEPDCLISGRDWFENLVEGARGNWMVGSHRKDYGPIHPTPSIWDLDQIKTSFETQPRDHDESHPRFRELFDLEHLRKRVLNEGDSWDWWGKYWDTAQRAWFLAAIEDKARLVEKAADFVHYWSGSRPDRGPHSFNDPRLSRYLEG